MTRIVAGRAGGRRLQVPPGTGVRPTSDRTREALFSTLGSVIDLAGTRFLDLYAGSGAVGLEALSRGAGAVVLVESEGAVARVIDRNIATVGLPGARVLRADVARFLAGPPEHYDVIFADPPYRVPDATLRPLLAVIAAGWAAPAAVVVVERASRGAPWDWPEGLVAVKDRSYGEGRLWYGRRP